MESKFRGGVPTTRRRDWAVPRRRAFTILELLISVGVVALLIALLLPALSSSREAARRVQCTSNLRLLGVALHQYHDEHGSLPIGWQWELSGSSAWGWGVSLLPFLEQQNLYYHIDRNQPIEPAIPQFLHGSVIPLMLCPSDITTPTFILFEEFSTSSGSQPLLELPTANYVGVFGTMEADDSFPAPPGEGPFVESRSVRFSDFDHGLTSTFLVGERTMARVPSTWLGVDRRGADAACRLVGSAMTAPNCNSCDECEFDSRHSDGANFLWGDGHVTRVSNGINTIEYRHCAMLDRQ